MSEMSAQSTNELLLIYTRQTFIFPLPICRRRSRFIRRRCEIRDREETLARSRWRPLRRLIAFHGRDFWIVEAPGTLASGHNDIAFVKFEPNESAHVGLRLCDKRLERLAFGREPETVVNQFAIFWDEAVAQVHHFAVHCECFHLTMGEMQNCAAGCLIHAAAFHSNKTVLDDVHATDSMFATKFVEHLQHLKWRHSGALSACNP